MPIVEETTPRPITPYGASKLMVEQILDDYEMAQGAHHATMRSIDAAGADR